mmetsp:Transcript_12746/g.24730  ORF Transcript_12746/g.24730 Transcript_12746/m.24730 type:complete len:482 (+) Transcript_12746:833-2278(+)
MTSQTMFPQMPIAREFIRPRQHHTWSIAIPVISAMTSATAIMPQKHRAELESLNLEHHLLGRPKVARAPKRTRLAAELSSQLLLVQLVRNGSVNARSSRNATKPWRRIVIPTSRELPNSRLKFKPCVTVVQSICARKMNSCAWKFASTRPSFAVLSAPHELSLNSPARSSTALCVAEVTVPLARLLALRTQVQLITHGIGLNTMHSTIWELVALLSSVCRCSPEDATLQTKKRFNVRIDMPWRPESMHDLRKRIWKAWTAPDIYKRAYSGAWTHNAEITIAEVPTGFEELQTSDDAELRIFHYTEDYRLDNETDEEKPPRDCTFVLTWKYTKLITASSFPENPKGQELGGQNNGTAKRPTYDYYPMHPPAEAFETVSKDDPEACIILCSTTSVDNAGFKPKQEGVQRISLPFIEGAIIRPGPNYQGCMWSILASWPLTDDGFAGFTNDNDLLNNDYSCGINGDALFSSIIENVNSINADDI